MMDVQTQGAISMDIARKAREQRADEEAAPEPVDTLREELSRRHDVEAQASVVKMLARVAPKTRAMDSEHWREWVSKLPLREFLALMLLKTTDIDLVLVKHGGVPQPRVTTGDLE